MRAEPEHQTNPKARALYAAVVVAALIGLMLMFDCINSSSATYDEITYKRIATHWWRTGEQEKITRMGSPLTFWKLQQAPVFWALDRSGLREAVGDPHCATGLLTLVRTWSLGFWLVALLVTALWARQMHGPRAMALAAWLFALSPNLLAHGALVTMELPVVACTTGVFYLFWRFLETGRRRWFWTSAALSGLAFSCKFTAVLVPPLLGLVWWVERWQAGERGGFKVTVRVAGGMLGFIAILFLVDFAITGFAVLPLSANQGNHPSISGKFGSVPGAWVARVMETPLPQDWVGFATQMRLQRAGGSSYLLGERRVKGWWYYYFVALAVKVPLTFWLLAAGRIGLRRSPTDQVPRHGSMLPIILGAYLAITAIGSSRNYGLRYLLPIAPLALVWVSALAEGGRWARRLAVVGLIGQAVAVAAIHPHELTYFNVLAGGPIGGRRILADSNLDWGQGLKALVRLQAQRPEFRDLTFYYFGEIGARKELETIAQHAYLIDAGTDHPDLPPVFRPATPYVAVSASLQHGPWGPAGYFRRLDGVEPIAYSDDTTIALYRVADIPQ